MAALILEIGTRGLHRYHPITGQTTTVGRALDNDIILSDPTVAPHHLKILHHADDSVEIVNLTDINPTRIGRERIDRQVTDQLPLPLEIGRVRARLLLRDQPVPATRPIAGLEGRHLFGHPAWVVLLVLASLLAGALEFYFSAYTDYKWSDLSKYVLRETVLSIGALVLALAVLERLLVNRWEIKHIVTAVCLVYLGHILLTELSDGLVYLVSASWPSTLFLFGWNLVLIPCAIALYLIHISHLKTSRSVLLAVLIASPIAIPAMLQSPEFHALLNDFSLAAPYQHSLSALNWHFAETVSIDSFVVQAQELDPGEFAD